MVVCEFAIPLSSEACNALAIRLPHHPPELHCSPTSRLSPFLIWHLPFVYHIGPGNRNRNVEIG